MMPVKKAMKITDKIKDLIDDEVLSDKLDILLSDYITLFERRENMLKRQKENREKLVDDEEKRIDRNLYSNLYYHNVLKVKKKKENEKLKKMKEVLKDIDEEDFEKVMKKLKK